MKASDYYFCVDTSNDPDSPCFCITSIEYWNENECLDDGGQDEDIEKHLPPKFHNEAEAQWGYVGTVEAGKQALLDAGFVYCDAMDDWINNYEARRKATYG